MSKKLCFDKNTFIFGIIIIIIIIIIISIYYNNKYNKIDNETRMHNLINKKILNIKDKIIQKKQEKELEKESEYEHKLESELELELESKLEQESKYESEYEFGLGQDFLHKSEVKTDKDKDIYLYKQEKELDPVNKDKDIYLYKQEKEEEEKLKQELKQELKHELEKINFKNNINDRLNDRDELIKYKINDEVQQRDLNVLLNPIYPPLARVERPIFDNLIKMNFQQSTRGSEDTYRLMGYLINSNKNDTDTGGDVWKLFGRQTYRGSSQGEFYVSPVNDHQSDMKIFLKNNMMPKEKIKDIYALPSEVYLDSPFFSKNAYTINELPKSDFNSNYL